MRKNRLSIGFISLGIDSSIIVLYKKWLGLGKNMLSFFHFDQFWKCLGEKLQALKQYSGDWLNLQ